MVASNLCMFFYPGGFGVGFGCSASRRELKVGGGGGVVAECVREPVTQFPN